MPAASRLPLVVMLRRAAVYVNMAGLHLTGALPAETMLYGVEAYLQTEDWLAERGAELVRRAA